MFKGRNLKIGVFSLILGVITLYSGSAFAEDVRIVPEIREGRSYGTMEPSAIFYVPEGDPVTFTMTPHAGYSVKDVKLDGRSVGAVTSYTFTAGSMMGYHTFLVYFKVGTSSTISASAGSGGSISPSGEVSVDDGGSKTFTMTPNSGYEVADVKVDGSSKGAVTSYAFSNVTSDHSISVTFKEVVVVQHTLTVSAGSGGSISPSDDVTVDDGGSQTFTITPDSGYEVEDVKVDGSSKGAVTSYAFSNVTSDHGISVTFREISSGPHTISASAASGGSISPSGEVSVDDGGSRTFTITPDSGYVVNDVTVDGSSKGAVTSYAFSNVTSGHTIHATFKEASATRYVLMASSGGNGTISPSGNIWVNEGESSTFTMTPAVGYMVEDVKVDSISEGPITSYTFTSVTSDHLIQVTFKEVSGTTYILAATSGENGSISPSGAIEVSEGGSRTFNMLPATGYMVEDVKVDGDSVGAVTSYTISSVTTDHLIRVSFKPISGGTQYGITATSGDNGAISPSGTIMVNEGESRTFNMLPSSGYVVEDVKVDDSSVGAMTSYAFASVSADHTIEVSFKVSTGIQHTITATSGSSGNIYPPGDVVVNEGESRTFTMVPDSGYLVDDVKVDGTSIGAVDSYAFSSVTDDHTIHVTFKSGGSLQYTINASSGNNGAIYPSGNVLVNAGEDVKFSMYIAAGYEVDDVFVDGKSVGPVATYTFRNVNANDHQIYVMFEKISGLQYTIEATSNDFGGSIFPSGSVIVNAGVSKTFDLYVGSGYLVEDVLIDGASIGSVDTYTFESVGDNHTIHAIFKSMGCVPGDADGDKQVTLRDVILNLQTLSGIR